MGAKRDEIVQRIAKLLYRTEARGATRPEAEACVALAHRLMLKHGIGGEELRDADDPVMRVIWTGATRPLEIMYVSSLVQGHFNVRVLSRRSPGRKAECLFGRPHHVSVAEHIWHYLFRSFVALYGAHHRRYGTRHGAKRAYCEGLAVGLHNRLADQTRRVAEADQAARSAIVRVAEDLHALAAYALGPIRKQRYPSGPYDEFSAIQGLMDSERIQLHGALPVEVA